MSRPRKEERHTPRPRSTPIQQAPDGNYIIEESVTTTSSVVRTSRTVSSPDADDGDRWDKLLFERSQAPNPTHRTHRPHSHKTEHKSHKHHRHENTDVDNINHTENANGPANIAEFGPIDNIDQATVINWLHAHLPQGAPVWKPQVVYPDYVTYVPQSVVERQVKNVQYHQLIDQFARMINERVAENPQLLALSSTPPGERTATAAAPAPNHAPPFHNGASSSPPHDQRTPSTSVTRQQSPHPQTCVPVTGSRSVTFAPSPMPPMPSYSARPGQAASPQPRTFTPLKPSVLGQQTPTTNWNHSNSPHTYATQSPKLPQPQTQVPDAVSSEILLPLIDEFFKTYVRSLYAKPTRACETIEDEVQFAQAHAIQQNGENAKPKDRPARPLCSTEADHNYNGMQRPCSKQPQVPLYPSIPVTGVCSSPYSPGCAPPPSVVHPQQTFMPVAMGYGYVPQYMHAPPFPTAAVGYGVPCGIPPMQFCGHHHEPHQHHRSSSRSHSHRRASDEKQRRSSYHKCCTCCPHDHAAAVFPAASKPTAELSSQNLQANCERTRPDPSKSRPHLQSVRSAFSSASGSTKSCSTKSYSSSYAESSMSRSTYSSWSSIERGRQKLTQSAVADQH